MEHQVEFTRTHNEDPDIPDAMHVRCACGWTSSAHSEEEARRLHGEHVASGEVPGPAPYTPSPD